MHLIPRGRAHFSPCERFRYTLFREWSASPSCLFLMLNPSTADAEQDDPTIRRCIGYAKAWGFGGLTVANLFALRSTDPAALYVAADPIGPDNDVTIDRLAREAGAVICAWGTHGARLDRGKHVGRRLTDAGVRLECLGTTRDGNPRHPLYLPRTAERLEWRPRA